jgi:hypothetical protein
LAERLPITILYLPEANALGHTNFAGSSTTLMVKV